MDRPAAFESGGAGLVSTIDDYLQFARMLLGGGSLEGRRILSPVTVKAFASSQLLEHQQKAFANWHGLEGYGYGRFLRVMKDPGQAMMIGSEGEYGWDGWLGCYFANLPALDAAILLMVQRVDSGTLAFTRRIRNVVLSAME
jgi:CubicO group peptidase (beta-lactamase class C family)